MHRCGQSAGFYKVTLTVMHQPEPYHVQILGHHDIIASIDGKLTVVEAAPWAGNEKPFEGELCVHEVQWLGGVPGKDYPMHYDFQVEKTG